MISSLLSSSAATMGSNGKSLNGLADVASELTVVPDSSPAWADAAMDCEHQESTSVKER